MKQIFTFLLLALFTLPAMACEGFENDMKALEAAVGAPAPTPAHASTNTPKSVFAREFENSDRLWAWAQTSTWGGGRVEEAEFHGRKFVFVYRSYTSGVKSSDAAIYMQDGEKWKLVKAYPVLMGKWIVADKGADQVLFHPEGENRSLMTLSRDDLAGL